MSRWDPDAEREFWRRKCLDSFWWFFRYAWGYDFNPRGAAGPNPWMDEATHKPACDWFEFHVKQWLADRRAGLKRQRKLMAVVPRDYGKTTLFTQAGQVWLHLHDAELASYTGCETMTRSREVLSGIKSVIGGEDRYARFVWLFGNQKHKDRRWKLDGIVTAARTNLTRRDSSYGLWAVETGLVGLHPDAAFFDDPNTYEKMAANSEWLELVNQHLDTLIPVFQSDALWMLTATRYGDNDHIGRSTHLEGVRTMTGMPMPGIKLDPTGLWHVFYLDAKREDGSLVMPKIWSAERMEGFERRNPMKFWAQVRNNPLKNPHNILTRGAIERCMVDDKDIDIKKLRVSIHMDTAFKTERRRARHDMNVIAACGHKMDGSGQVVFLGARWSPDWESKEFGDELVKYVAEMHSKCHRVVCMTDEEEIGGKPGLWTAHLQNIFAASKVRMPELFILNRGGKAKLLRLSEAATLWRDGRMLLPRNAPGLDYLIEQMTQIGMTTHDDFADPVCDAFHKKVYTSVHSIGMGPATPQETNPFDDLLKPGPQAHAALERIAEMTDAAQRFAFDMEGHDVVAP